MRETPFQDSTMPDGQKLPNGPSSTNGHSETQCTTRIDEVGVHGTVHMEQCTGYSVQCTVYTVQCTTRIDEVGAQGTVHRIQCTLFVEGTVHRKQCKRSVWTGLLFFTIDIFQYK